MNISELLISNEILARKMKFLSQYYGVKCFQNIANEKYGFGTYFTPILDESGLNNEFCVLRKLESLTNEHLDIIQLTMINIIGIDGLIKQNSKELTKEIILNYQSVNSLFMLPSSCVDKLRQLGYAADWDGYNIDKQLELGWIKFE